MGGSKARAELDPLTEAMQGALDRTERSQDLGRAAHAHVADPERVAWAIDLARGAATAAGRDPATISFGMYVNVDYWRNVDTTGFFGDFLWIATADRAAGDPGIQAPWLFHQYSAAGVDRDFCHLGSTAELRAWALSFAAPKPPPAPTPPSPPLVRPSKEQDMIIVQVDRKTVPTTTPPTAWPGDFLLADGKLSYVPTVADVKAFQAAGVAGPVVISWEMYQSLLAGK